MALTSRDKSLIQESWVEYKKGDIVDQGVHMFLRIFEKRPDIKHMWKFSDDEDTAEHYKSKTQFRYHVKRLFSTIGTMVAEMDDLSKMEATIEDLGGRHNQYGARREHFAPVGDGLLYALGHALGNNFTPEMKVAWVKLYSIMEEIMHRRMQEED